MNHHHLDEPPGPSEPARDQNDPGDGILNYQCGSILNSIDEGFCIIEVLFDQDGKPTDYRFLETNAAFETATGLKDALGKRMRELVPNHEQHWFDIYGQIASTRQAARFEQRAAALNRWYDVYAFPFGPAEQQQVAVLFNDISKRKEAEEALRASEQRYRLLVSIVTDVPWSTNAVGEFVTLKTTWGLYTGQTWDDYRGSGWINAFHPDDRADIFERWRQALATRALFQLNGRLFHARSGEYRYCEARAAPLLGNDGVVREWIGSCRDVHEEKLAAEHLERTVRERTAELQETIGDLEAFSYTIAHDLRAPLRAMQGFAAILSEENAANLSVESRQHLQRIITAAARMDRLIQDVLNYSRVVRADLPMTAINTELLLREIVDSYLGLQSPHARISIEGPIPRVPQTKPR